MNTGKYIALLIISVFLAKLIAFDFNGLNLFIDRGEATFVKSCQKKKDYKDTSKFKAENNHLSVMFDQFCHSPYFFGFNSLPVNLLMPTLREYGDMQPFPVDFYFEKLAPPPKS